LKSLPPEKIVDMVKNGSMIPQDQCLSGADNLNLRQSLFEAGWISAIVSFLNQGAHTEFKIDDTLKEHVSLIIGGGGKGKFQHVSPKLWLVALVHSTEQEFSLNKENCEKLCVEIAGGIRPLVACMCDDITREFFKSNAYYHESLSLFFDLIRRLAGYSSKAAEVLLEYDSLICLVVQCLFWRTHRPDIMEELTSHHTSSALEAIEKAGRYVIDCFTLCSMKELDDKCKVYDDRAKTYFKVMATTPIVSNAFDPDNDGIFLSNIASLMKADGFYNLKTTDRDFYFDVLLHSSWAGCIDKNVISSVVDLFSSVRQCDVAVRVVDMTFNLLCKRTGQWIGDRGEKPVVTEDDERFAVAINAGMISACLTMLKRFDGQREYPELLDNMHNLLDSLHKVCKVARKKRSARAIESNRGLITEDLKTSEQYLTGFKETSILKLVKSTLFILDYCAKCAKVLEKKDVRRCSRCMVVKYCSRECQVEHWRNGSHKVFCNAAAAKAKQIKSDGGTEEDVRLQNSMLHIEMSGDEVARKHSASVVFQAISKGHDILDCIVDIDLRVSPPTIEVMLSEDFLSLDMNKESEMHAVKKMKVDEARG